MSNVHIIDGSIAPLVPRQWHLFEHRPCRPFVLEEETVIPLVLERQNCQIPASRIFEILRGMSEYEPLNNVLLHFFLEHPDLIPEHLLGVPLIFPETRFREQDGSEHVLQLRWLPGNKGVWASDLWLARCLSPKDPIAVIKKSH